MALIRLLENGEVRNIGIYAIVGAIRRGYAILGMENQGKKMHGLLLDLAQNRGSMKGTKIKQRNANGRGFTPAKKWVHNDGNVDRDVMHYSTGEMHKSAEDHSVTVFFYHENNPQTAGVVTVIAAGRHIENSKDYSVLWGERIGETATV